MNGIRYIFSLGIMFLLALSCTKEGHEAAYDGPILVGAEVSQTKAFLEETFNANSTITVYDLLTASGSSAYHMKDVGVKYDGNGWSYVENTPHRWKEGDHKFFGWITKDGGMAKSDTPESFFGNGFGFNETTQVLTIPEKQMPNSTAQFDFVYSDIVQVSHQKGGNPGRVDLMMNHLFTAVSFGAVNGTKYSVTIEEFKIEDILNKRSATIDYKGKVPVIAYVDGKQDQYLSRTSSSYTILPEKSVANIFDGSNNRNYMMLWPLASSYIHSNNEVNPGDDGNVDYPSDYPTDYKMYIKYKFDDGTDESFQKRINFPDIDLEAGKKFHFDITFADKIVELKTSVNPWIHDTQIIDYANSAVTVPGGGILSWDDEISTLMESESGEKLVVIKNGQPAEADFTIDTPLGGVWLISLSGDIDAFRVTPDSGEIDARTAHIRVVPLIYDPKREYKVKLKFAVRRPDGRIIAADELVQPVATKRSVVLSPM